MALVSQHVPHEDGPDPQGPQRRCSEYPNCATSHDLRLERRPEHADNGCWHYISAVSIVATGAAEPETGPIELFARRWRWWILGAIVVVGAIVRGLGVHEGTLTRDDAWVALSARVPIGTAVHMLVTTPGFTLFERTWIGLNPQPSWWAQLPSMIAGVALIPAIYGLLRDRATTVWLSLLGALLASCVPAGVVYSTHVKSFSFDALWVCLLLVAAWRTNKTLTTTRVLMLGVVGIAASWWSLSLAIPVVGVWAVMVLRCVWQRRLTAAVVVAAGATGGSLLLERLVLSRQITAALHDFWHSYFIDPSSASGILHGLTTLSWRLVGMLTINRGGTPPLLLGLGALAAWVFVVWLAARRAPTEVGILGVALIASLVHLAPLGTARTDIYLVPVLIVLLVSAAGHGLSIVDRRRGARTATALACAGAAGIVLMAVFLLGVISPAAIKLPNKGNLPFITDLRPVHAAAMRELDTPGSVLLVEEPLWVWAYYFVDPLRVEHDPHSLTSFTVVGSDARVILPRHADGHLAFFPPTTGNRVRHATRLITVRPSQMKRDPVATALRRDCWFPGTPKRIGDDLLTIYLRGPSCSASRTHAP